MGENHDPTDSGISDDEDQSGGLSAQARGGRITRQPTATLDHGARRVTVKALAFACDGELLVTGDGDGRVRVWNSRSTQLHYTQHKHSGAITSVTSAVGGDARDLAASCSADSKVHVWEVRSNLSLFFLSQHTSTVWKAVFAPRGAVQLATCSADHVARVWETRSGRATCTLKGHTGGVVGIAWSPDGSRNIATCSWDRTARVWNGLTGKCLHTLAAHHDWVTAVAYSGDGTALATCSNDCTVRVWSPLSGKLVRDFELCDGVRNYHYWNLYSTRRTSVLNHCVLVANKLLCTWQRASRCAGPGSFREQQGLLLGNLKCFGASLNEMHDVCSAY